MARMELTDAAAVSRARGGDADAFRLLVDRHSHAVFRVAYRMTGNEHDADDVVQETLLRAYRQLTRFEERANFGTWLHRIAINCSLDLLRARGRADKHYGGDPEDVEQHLAGCAECRVQFETLRRVLALVDSMPIPERGETYSEQVWTRLRWKLGSERRRTRRWQVAFAAAAMLAIAFVSGI